MPFRSIDGSSPEWKPFERLQLHEAVPSLGTVGKGRNALKTYLNRQPIWRQLKGEAEATGYILLPYNFPHSYSYEGQRLEIPATDLDQTMDNSFACHLRVYARFTSNETINAFFTATTRLMASLAYIGV